MKTTGRILAVVSVCLAVWSQAAWANGPTNFPFADNFETYTNQTPLIDGLNGWYANSSSCIVQTNFSYTNYGGAKAAQVPIDVTLSNRFVGGTPTNVWTRFYTRAMLYNGQTNPVTGRAQPVVDTNSSATFFINSDGFFVVHNGRADPDPTNSTKWVTLINTCVSADQWTRVDVYLDYQRTNWSLYANGVRLMTNIGFVKTSITNFTGFDLYNGGSTSYLDNVYVSRSKTLMIDGLTASNKIYDGNTGTSVRTNNLTLVGVDGADAVNLVISSTTTGQFDNANVGTGKTVTVTGLTLGGAQAANYSLYTNTTANITAQELSYFTVATTHSGFETASVAFAVTVVARDWDGSTYTNYDGSKTVAWTWTATAAPGGTVPTKPADGAQTFNLGTGTIAGFTLYNSGETPTITATADSKSGTSGAITVSPDPDPAGTTERYLKLTGPASVVTDAFSSSITLTTLDQYSNAAPVTNTTTFVLASSGGATYEFNPASPATIATDSSLTTFTYKNTNAGTFTITSTYASGDKRLIGKAATYDITVKTNRTVTFMVGFNSWTQQCNTITSMYATALPAGTGAWTFAVQSGPGQIVNNSNLWVGYSDVTVRATIAEADTYASAYADAAVTVQTASPATNSIPWSDNFESYYNGTPLINGITGWYASASSCIVQQNVKKTGAQAAMIPVDVTLSNKFNNATNRVVRMEAYVQPQLYNGSNYPTVATNVAVQFFVNSNGYFVIANGTTWRDATTMANGAAAIPIADMYFTRIQLNLRYRNYTWNLKAWVSDTLVANTYYMNFTSNLNNFGGFDVYSGNSTSYVDDVSVTNIDYNILPKINGVPFDNIRTINGVQPAAINGISE